MNKQFAVLFVSISFIFMSFACKSDKELIITVINEMQACEEENIYYRIIDINDSSTSLISERDSLVLFFFEDDIKTQENYKLFYPAQSERRMEFVLKGIFMKDKVERNNSYGCPGSSKFKVSEILYIRDITDEATYPINNR